MNKERSGTAFIGCEAAYANSGIVLFGAPFDGTTSYRPGARFGPAAMRGESYGLETYSPYIDRDLTEFAVHDSGDLELPFGNTTRVLDMIEACAQEIVTDGKRPVMLGGEHLTTLGCVRAMVRAYPELCVLHLDAHADLRDNYLGEQLSHATVMRRCWDILGDNRIWQFGIRSGERAEFAFAAAHTHMRRFDFAGLQEACSALQGKPVYVTIDMDVLDSGVFPGTGTPEAGGVGFAALVEALDVMMVLQVVGADLVELSPPNDAGGASTALACKLLRELLVRMG